MNQHLIGRIKELSPPQAVMNFGKDSQQVLKSHNELLQLHAKTLACHCECMGMMSENMLSATSNLKPLFGTDQFISVMKKWRVLDEEGVSIL